MPCWRRAAADERPHRSVPSPDTKSSDRQPERPEHSFAPAGDHPARAKSYRPVTCFTDLRFGKAAAFTIVPPPSRSDANGSGIATAYRITSLRRPFAVGSNPGRDPATDIVKNRHSSRLFRSTTPEKQQPLPANRFKIPSALSGTGRLLQISLAPTDYG